MRTSYSNSDLNYGDILQTVIYIVQPKKILEIGILDGYSLTQFINSSNGYSFPFIKFGVGANLCL